MDREPGRLNREGKGIKDDERERKREAELFVSGRAVAEGGKRVKEEEGCGDEEQEAEEMQVRRRKRRCRG